MKEIRCLAVLNHPNLIQYYYAWNECPPNGWQNEEDKRLVINKYTFLYLNIHLNFSLFVRNSTGTFTTSVISSDDNELAIQSHSENFLPDLVFHQIIDFTFERSLNPSQVHEDSTSSLLEHSYDTSDEELPDTDDKIISKSLIEKENSDCPTTYFILLWNYVNRNHYVIVN